MSVSPIYLFEGEGIDPICLKYTETMLERYENPIIKIDYSYLKNNLNVGTLVFSGGNANKQFYKIEEMSSNIFNGLNEDILFDLVKKKHFNYIGICAGSYLKYLAKNENSFTFRLSQGCSSEDNQNLRLRKIRPINNENSCDLSVVYIGGPEFFDPAQKVKVITKFSDNEMGAVILQNYFFSKSLLFSYHPEFSTENFLNDVPYDFKKLVPENSQEEFFSSLQKSKNQVESLTAAYFQDLEIHLKTDVVLG